MLVGVGCVGEVQRCHQVPPPEELSADRRTGSAGDREVGETENPLVSESEGGCLAFRQGEPGGPIHLVPNHQDLLIEVEPGPAIGIKTSVLSHGRASPRPMRR